MSPVLRFYSNRPVPPEHRSNFRHLYLDIAWYGLLAASSLGFVGVYAARLGATAFQVGLLSVGPAIANLIFALPVGRWLERQKIDAAIFWTAVFHRAFYLVWIFLPFFLGAQGQIWALVGLTLVMHIPGTALAIGFNALFAEAVPPGWRGHVAGVRNALLSVTFIAISLICGQILQRMTFPIGYQVVFIIGFVGGAMSTFHLWFVVPHRDGRKGSFTGRGLRDLVWRSGQTGTQAKHGHRFRLPRIEVLRGSYGKLIAVLFGFHLTLYLSIPLFPVHWVNNLHLTDGQIGLGTALFYVSVFFGSTQLSRLVQRIGNQHVTAAGALFMASYPAWMAAADGPTLFFVGSACGGLGWSMAGGALSNYLLEKIPGDDRPAYLAWYNLAINAAVLLGSLIGPVVGRYVGIPVALFLGAALRLVMAIVIWRWE
ncbi:MAG: MFS transporter [Anaerolineae bacterium]|nr:MFS transporter [Anaerolineae bacterium]